MATSNNFSNFVVVTSEQFDTLKTNGSITIGDITYQYDATTTIYLINDNDADIYYTQTEVNNLVDALNTNIASVSDNVEEVENKIPSLDNYYDKDEINTLIASLKESVVQIVSTLPTTGETGVIYLLVSGSSYETYVWENSAWVSYGSSSITDLSDYYTKTEVDNKIDTLETSLNIDNYYTKTEVDSKVSTLETSLNTSINTNTTSINALSSSISSKQDQIYINDITGD